MQKRQQRSGFEHGGVIWVSWAGSSAALGRAAHCQAGRGDGAGHSHTNLGTITAAMGWPHTPPEQQNSRQTQDSGTSGQGPKQASANYNNVLFTPVFVFFALVSLASPKFILEFKDDWSSLSDLESGQEQAHSFKLVSPQNFRLPVAFQNLHGQVLFQENAWW